MPARQPLHSFLGRPEAPLQAASVLNLHQHGHLRNMLGGAASARQDAAPSKHLPCIALACAWSLQASPLLTMQQISSWPAGDFWAGSSVGTQSSTSSAFCVFVKSDPCCCQEMLEWTLRDGSCKTPLDGYRANEEQSSLLLLHLHGSTRACNAACLLSPACACACTCVHAWWGKGD